MTTPSAQSTPSSGRTRKQLNKQILYESLLNQSTSYEPEDVLCRSDYSYKAVHGFLESEMRYQELRDSGWSSKRNLPYKCLGEPVLDLKTLEHKRREFEWEILPTPTPTKEPIEATQLPSIRDLERLNVPKSLSLKIKLHEAEERLKTPLAAVPLYDLLSQESFMQKMKEIGKNSMPLKRNEGLDPSATNTGDSGGQNAKPSTELIGNDNTSDYPSDGRKARIPSLSQRRSFTPSDRGSISTPPTAKRPLAPLKLDEIEATTAQTSRAQVESPANGVPRPPPRGLMTARTYAEHQGRVLRDPRQSLPSEASPPHEKRALWKESSSDAKRDNVEPKSPDRKASVFQKKDIAFDFKAIRLRALREQIQETMRDQHKSQWFITLLALISDSGRQLGQHEEYLMSLINKISAEDAKLNNYIFYGILKTIPYASHLSADVQKIISYLRQEVFKVPLSEFRAWNSYNNIPTPEIQAGPPRPVRNKKGHAPSIQNPSSGRSSLPGTPYGPESGRYNLESLT